MSITKKCISHVKVLRLLLSSTPFMIHKGGLLAMYRKQIMSAGYDSNLRHLEGKQNPFLRYRLCALCDVFSLYSLYWAANDNDREIIS